MLHNQALIKSLLLQAWFIDPAYADLMLPGVIEMIEGKNTHPNLKTHEKQIPYCLNADLSTVHRRLSDRALLDGGNHADSPSGSPFAGFSGTGTSGNDAKQPDGGFSAVIPIRGAITKYEGWCNYGVENYMAWIDDAEAADAVSEIILLIDSPGGEANSAFMLAQRIAQATKPTLAYIDSGLAASAAYLIASAADQIWVNTPVDIIGSIGAMFSISSYKSQLEGTKTWEIYSRHSTEKNLPFRRLQENNDTTLLQDMLDDSVMHFIDAVKTNRGDRLNLTEADPFKGATYSAAKALKMGLIDGIGPMQTAMTSVRSRGTAATVATLQTTELIPETTNNTHTENEEDMSLRQMLMDLLAKTPEETTPAAEVTTPTTEAVTEPTTAPETPQLTVEQRLAAMETRLTTLQTENDQLKSKTPAAAPTMPVVAKEEIPAPVETKNEVTSFFSETDEQVAKMRAGIA